MKTLKHIFYAVLTLTAFTVLWSCGEDDPVEEPQRPNTEKPDNGGNNNGDNNGGNNGGSNGDNGGYNGDNGDNGGQTKPDPVVTFSNAVITDITYNHAKLSAKYTMENVEESTQNKIVCRLSSAESELDMDYSVYQELPLDKTGMFDIDFYLGQNTTYYVRLDIVIGKTVFKSNVLNFSTPEKPYIPVEGITLSETAVTMKVGEIKELEAFVQPKDADNKKVNWFLYAYQPYPVEWTVVVGTDYADKETKHIKAVNPGTARIEVVIEDEGKKFTAECVVTVVE